MVQSLMANSGSNWSVDNLLNNLNSSLNNWAVILVAIVGVVMCIVGVFKIAKGLMSKGQGQVNWVLNIALILIGGALAFGGGWGLVSSLSSGAEDTLNNLGHSIVIDVSSLGVETNFS